MNLRIRTRKRERRRAIALRDHTRAMAQFGTMRWDQMVFANNLLASWGHRDFFSGRPITIAGNFHVPAVRRAIRKALEQRP